MDTSTLAFESVADLAIRLREGSINSTSLVEQLLDRISKLDAQLHSFIAVMPERALAAARVADITLKARQDLGPLHGIPYAAKDLFDVRGMPTTAGTRLRENHRGAADATDYGALLQRRAELQRRIQRTLQDVDALLVPTTMIPAAPLSTIDQTLDTYIAYNSQYNRNAMLGNYFNWCAVSVPCGFTQNGLPIGLMIYCKPFHEHVALRVAHAYEQATEWHLRRPTLAWAEKRVQSMERLRSSGTAPSCD